MLVTPRDVVIADYSDADRITDDLRSAASRPELLPILYKPSKALEAEAEKRYSCLIKPHAMSKFDALAEIDRARATYESERGRRHLVAARAAVEAWARLVDPTTPELRAAWSQVAQGLREAHDLAVRGREVFGSEPLFVSEGGPVTGTYTGPGLLGLGGLPLRLLA